MFRFTRQKTVIIRLQSPQPRPPLLRRVLHTLLWLPYAAGLMLITGVGSVLWLVSSFCHMVGLALLWPPKTIARSLSVLWEWFLSDVSTTAATAPRRFAQFSTRQFSASLVLFAGIAVISFGVLRVGNLFAEGFDLKGRVLGQATNAVKLLAQGKEQIGKDNIEGASQRFAFAVDNFRAGQEAIHDSNVVIKALLAVLPQGKDAQNLLKAGEAGSRAAGKFAELSHTLKTFTFDATGFYSTDGSANIAQVQDKFEQVRAETTEALRLIETVDADSVPSEYRQRLSDLQGQLTALRSSLGILDQVFTVASSLFSGDKHVLLLLQNSNELRPTGGFPGTYGAFSLSHGRVTEQTISSIYDLDGQLQKHYVPPMPLFAVNNRWFLRDSNWFASFPESAETMFGFYEAEAHKTPDIVIGITPQLATRLLALTGPITVPGYATPLDADNFIEVTQVETSVYYDREENKPKKMLSEFFPLFLARIGEGLKQDPTAYIDAFRQSLAAKDMIAYSRNQTTQQALRELSWDGSIAESNRDYLSIVSANLGGTKTDLDIKQAVSLDSSIQSDGSVQNTLRITRTNPLPKLKGLTNKTFMRVFVPLGSKLVSSKGFSYVDLDVKYGQEGDAHPRVEAWEQAAVREVGSGMLVGEESGKTYFGNWVELAGGEQAKLELVYTLPMKLANLDRYSIAIQKQPGANAYTLQYNLKLGGRNLLWATTETTASDTIAKELVVDRDRFYGVVVEAAE